MLLDKDLRNRVGNLGCQFFIGVFRVHANELRILDRLYADVGFQFGKAQPRSHCIQHRSRQHQLGEGLGLSLAGNDRAINALVDAGSLIHEDRGGCPVDRGGVPTHRIGDAANQQCPQQHEPEPAPKNGPILT